MLDFQNYLRTQSVNNTTVNIIISTVDYLLRVQVSLQRQLLSRRISSSRMVWWSLRAFTWLLCESQINIFLSHTRNRSVISTGSTRGKMWLICTVNKTSQRPLKCPNRSSTHSLSTYRSVLITYYSAVVYELKHDYYFVWQHIHTLWIHIYILFFYQLNSFLKRSSSHCQCVPPGPMHWEPTESGSQSSVGRCGGIPPCLCQHADEALSGIATSSTDIQFAYLYSSIFTMSNVSSEIVQ